MDKRYKAKFSRICRLGAQMFTPEIFGGPQLRAPQAFGPLGLGPVGPFGDPALGASPRRLPGGNRYETYRSADSTPTEGT
jgi:hypothetical protein